MLIIVIVTIDVNVNINIWKLYFAIDLANINIVKKLKK